MYSICVPYIKNSDERYQWNYVFKNWNFNKIYFLCDVDLEENLWASAPLLRNFNTITISSMSEISEALIYVTPKDSSVLKGVNNLTTFNHPEECCYAFGSNSYPYFTEIETGTTVYIDVIDELFSWCAASIVFYDRNMKNGN